MKSIKKIVIYILTALLFVFAFTGCEKGKSHSFVWFVQGIPQTVDPQLASSPSEMTAVVNMFEGLFRKNLEGKVEQAAVESFTVSEDGLKYTFKLKDDLKYNFAFDEKENKYVKPTEQNKAVSVTATDFVFAFKRVFLKETNSPYALELAAVKNSNEVLKGIADTSRLGVKAKDEKTLEITLSYPDPEFITKLCLPGAFPCNEDFFNYCKGAYGLVGEKKPNSNIMANGEFNITVWNETDGFTLRRETKDNTQINRIRLVTEGEYFAEEVAQTSSSDEPPVFPTEEERLADGTSNGEILSATSGSGYNETLFSSTNWTLSFNCKDKYFKNANIRAGLRDCSLFSKIYDENLVYSSATGLIPKSVTLFEKSFRDEATGNVMPKDNGSILYKQGQSELYAEGVVGGDMALTKVKILVPDTPELVKMTEILSQLWQRDLSAFYSIEPLPLAELTKRVKAGDYQLAIYPFTAVENNVLSLLTRFSKNSRENVWGYDSPYFDGKLENISESIGMGQRMAQYISAEDTLLSDAVCVPLWSENSVFALSGVKNVVIDPFGPVVDLKWAQTDE